MMFGTFIDFLIRMYKKAENWFVKKAWPVMKLKAADWLIRAPIKGLYALMTYPFIKASAKKKVEKEVQKENQEKVLAALDGVMAEMMKNGEMDKLFEPSEKFKEIVCGKLTEEEQKVFGAEVEGLIKSGATEEKIYETLGSKFDEKFTEEEKSLLAKEIESGAEKIASKVVETAEAKVVADEKKQVNDEVMENDEKDVTPDPKEVNQERTNVGFSVDESNVEKTKAREEKGKKASSAAL